MKFGADFTIRLALERHRYQSILGSKRDLVKRRISRPPLTGLVLENFKITPTPSTRKHLFSETSPAKVLAFAQRAEKLAAMKAPRPTIADVRLARGESEVRRCWPAFKELRPHLRSEDELVERWRIQAREGFQIIYLPEGDTVPAAAGYRFLHTLAWGHILYIDDLVAIAARHGTGLGTTLLCYLQAEARRLGCDAVHLDTGYQRHLAHKAYLRNGFHFKCHHLAWQVRG